MDASTDANESRKCLALYAAIAICLAAIILAFYNTINAALRVLRFFVWVSYKRANNCAPSVVKMHMCRRLGSTGVRGRYVLESRFLNYLYNLTAAMKHKQSQKVLLAPVLATCLKKLLRIVKLVLCTMLRILLYLICVSYKAAKVVVNIIVNKCRHKASCSHCHGCVYATDVSMKLAAAMIEQFEVSPPLQLLKQLPSGAYELCDAAIEKLQQMGEHPLAAVAVASLTPSANGGRCSLPRPLWEAQRPTESESLRHSPSTPGIWAWSAAIHTSRRDCNLLILDTETSASKVHNSPADAAVMALAGVASSLLVVDYPHKINDQLVQQLGCVAAKLHSPFDTPGDASDSDDLMYRPPHLLLVLPKLQWKPLAWLYSYIWCRFSNSRQNQLLEAALADCPLAGNNNPHHEQINATRAVIRGVFAQQSCCFVPHNTVGSISEQAAPQLRSAILASADAKPLGGNILTGPLLIQLMTTAVRIMNQPGAHGGLDMGLLWSAFLEDQLREASAAAKDVYSRIVDDLQAPGALPDDCMQKAKEGVELALDITAVFEDILSLQHLFPINLTGQWAALAFLQKLTVVMQSSKTSLVIFIKRFCRTAEAATLGRHAADKEQLLFYLGAWSAALISAALGWESAIWQYVNAVSELQAGQESAEGCIESNQPSYTQSCLHERRQELLLALTQLKSGVRDWRTSTAILIQQLSTRRCNVCFEDFVVSNKMPAVPPPQQASSSSSQGCCEHFFCCGCMKLYVAERIQDRKYPICCPDAACGEELSHDDITQLLQDNRDLLEVFEVMAVEHSISPSSRIYCPYNDCSCLLIGPEEEDPDNQLGPTECPSCHRAFCPHCKIAGWHTGMTCEQFQALPPPLRSVADAALLVMGEHEGWRRCPSCGVVIERTQGCNHMTCSLCHVGFCYRCGKQYRSADPTANNVHGLPGCDCTLFER